MREISTYSASSSERNQLSVRRVQREADTQKYVLMRHGPISRVRQLGGSFQQSALLARWIIIGTISGSESVPPGNGGLSVSSAR
jgi:hypothetical protein